jgi:Flp pilus assembly protein TadG
MRRTNRLGADRDAGAIPLFVAIVTPALLLCVGLVSDLGTQLRIARTATDAAQEAARAGADASSSTLIAGGGVQVATLQAAAAARSYLSSAGLTGTAAATGPHTITVSVTVTQGAPLLSSVGVPPLTVTKTATASLERGITGQG